MKRIDQFCLISGSPVDCDGVAVYQPKLGDIRDFGYDEYQECLSSFLITKEHILEIVGIKPEDYASVKFDAVQLVTLIPEFRASLLRALNFFLHEEVVYDEDFGYLMRESNEPLTIDHIWKIRRTVVEVCRLSDEEEETPKSFANEKARQIYEKIQKKKAQAKKMRGTQEANPNLALPNLISALCAYSPTYNLLNIWDLTVYQFYDQFSRLDDKIQLEVCGQRWAAWGKDSFDFSVWHKAHAKT